MEAGKREKAGVRQIAELTKAMEEQKESTKKLHESLLSQLKEHKLIVSGL